MIEEFRNSIVIRNVDTDSKEYSRFRNAFSIYDTVTHKYGMQVYEFVGNDVHIPSTVSSTVVQSYFTNQIVNRNFNVSAKAADINFSMLHTPKNIIQEEALQFLQSMKDDTDVPWRMLNLKTGSGKTYVTISALSYLKQKAFIVVDTTDLAEQWKREILFHTDLEESDIFIISGKESIEVAKNGNFKIFIAIHATLTMILTEDSNSVNALMNKLKIGIRVFDECHVNFHNICMINALSNVNYTIFLTATPERSEFKEDILYSKVFKRVPSYDGHKSENEKYHTIVLANFDSHPDDKKKVGVKTKYGFSLNRWAGFLSDDDCYSYYKDALLKIIKTFQLIERKRKVAIMLPTIDLIDKTYDDLKTEYPDIDIGKFVGEVKKTKRSEELSKIIFITNHKIFGKAIDVSDLDCIINFVPLSSRVNLEQLIGRLRNNPGHSHVVIDVTDIGYKECMSQSKLRKRFYKKIAKNIKEIKETL